MPQGFIHDALTFVALGNPCAEVHRHKDAAASQRPGLLHRRIRHGWYRAFGRLWDFTAPFPEVVKQRIAKFLTASGPTSAERYMASLGHDLADRVWRYDELTHEERRFTRKYWESFWVWVILNPGVLQDWGGVNVISGKIQRLIDGRLIWEDAPDVEHQYQVLKTRALFLLKVDKPLREMFQHYDCCRLTPPS